MSDSSYPLVLLAQSVVFGMVALILSARRRETALSPMLVYMAFHGVVFVARPWLEWSLRLDGVWSYMGYFPSDGEKTLALAVSSACLVAICAGYLHGMVRSPNRMPPRDFVCSNWDARALLFTWIAAAPIAIYSMWITRNGVGLADRASVAMEVVDGVIVSTAGSGYANDIQNVVIGLAALSIAFKRYRLVALVMLALYFSRKLLTGGGRWGIVLPMAGFALLYMVRRGYRWPPVWLIPLAVPVIFLFASLGEDRYAITKMLEGRSHELTTRGSLRDRVDGLDFANFEYLAFVTSVVPERTTTHSYGVQYLQLLTEPIPRSVWKAKPAGQPVKLFDLNDYGNFFGLTVSLPGDLWITAGWLGVLAGGWAVGLAMGVGYSRFRLPNQSSYAAVAYVMAIPLLIQLFRDGSLVSFAKFALFVLGPILVVRHLSEFLSKRPKGRQLISGVHS